MANPNDFHVSGLGGSKIPPHIKPRPGWGPNFSSKYGFALKFPGGFVSAVFIDSKLKTSNRHAIMAHLKHGKGRMRVITCENKVWTGNTEVIGANEFRVSLAAESGKIMMTGKGRVSSNGDIEFSVATVYPGVSNSKKTTATVKGECNSNGVCTISASVGVEF